MKKLKLFLVLLSILLFTGQLYADCVSCALPRTITGGTGIAAIGDLTTDRTITFDSTELSAALIWGDGTQATQTWTYSLSGATDPVWTYGNNLANLSTGTLQVGGSGVASASNNLSFFAATTSLQLLGVISDEVGTGSLVFGTAPTFTTNLTTPVMISTIATGTAPLTVTSTTPVANLTTIPAGGVFDTAGVQVAGARFTFGQCTLDGAATATCTIAVAFTSATSYVCASSSQTNTNSHRVARTSSTVVTVTSAVTLDTGVVNLICVGN